MIKTFLILTILQNLIFASEQIILVIGDDFNSSKANMYCYEDDKKVFDKIIVNIGKNGLGWGLGEVKLTQKPHEAIKKEGDKKAPVGIFKLVSSFGYAKKEVFNIKYTHLSKNLICVDDSKSNFYNQIITMPNIKPKSYEIMRRNDKQYELGIVVAHNKNQIKKAGSCIFIHVQKSKNSPTAGCTSMSLKNIKKILKWLDKKKNPILIQIPKSSLSEVKKLFPHISINL